MLTVAGVDPEGRASVEASTQGITIGVSAPSEDLVGVSADGRLVLWNGTSGAAPIVAGIAALVRAAHPDLDAANVINRIIRTARPRRRRATPTAPDPLYGYGLVDAAAAVSANVPSVIGEPDGQPRGVDPPVPAGRRRDPLPAPTVEPVEVAAAAAGGRRDPRRLAAAAVRRHPALRHAAADGWHQPRLYWWRSASPQLSDASDWRPATPSR